MRTRRTLAKAAAVTVALAVGGLVQPAAAQTAGNNANGLPGYSARPAGMCWVREVGSGHDLTGGYWAACNGTSANQTARATRAQAPQYKLPKTR